MYIKFFFFHILFEKLSNDYSAKLIIWISSSTWQALHF